MHEHYEDGPWREQALYVLDSRNQMLCGYKAFKSFSYQRENLILMSKGINEFGLLDLCFPSGINFPIPFFSLCYPLAVLEYIKNTNDKTILSKVSDAIYSIIKLFDSKIDENGLIANFPYPFWNFYEWSDGSHHCWETGRKPTDKYEKVYDLILNCAYIIAKKCCDELFNTKTDFTIMKSNIKKAFYNSDRGLYKLSTDSDLYSKVGNAFSILAQIDSSLDNKIIDSILHNHKLIPATLSMSGFVYDALLTKDNRYIQYVIEDIKDKYTKMLNSGATTFWETENGEADFNGVGSLCHGWSALPIYYIWLYNSFNTNRRI